MNNPSIESTGRLPRRSWTERVTPASAAKYLSRSRGNRPLKHGHVKSLARVMASGEWGDSNDRVSFDWNGTLINGHHRLTAVIESGASVTMDFVEGLDPASFVNMDRNCPRSHGVVLGLAMRDGERMFPNGGRVASIAGFVWRFERGDALDGWDNRPTTNELLDVAERHPGIGASGDVAAVASKIIPVSIGGFIHYSVCRKRPELAASFFDILATGIAPDGDATHPTFRFREAIQRDDRSRVGWNGRARMIRASFRAWNLHARGEHVKRFIMDPRIDVLHPLIGSDLQRRR